MPKLLTGKLPNKKLAPLLRRFGSRDPRVLVGPGVGSDVALIDMNGVVLAAKTDPITFATERVGWYAVHVNANDIVCSGADPRWFLATLLLPEHVSDDRLVEEVFAQIDGACRQVGATLCGGHTEVTHGIDRPIVVGQMLGEVAPERVLTSAKAKLGDELILTKGLAIEGTAILAGEFSARLTAVAAATLTRARGFLDDPGISVVQDARVLREVPGMHALHDPTEGGIRQAVNELADAAGLGARVFANQLPVLGECTAVCDVLQIDPLALISSGALLAAVAPEAVDRALRDLTRHDIEASRIGTLVAPSEGVEIVTSDGRSLPFQAPARDELARFYDTAEGG